MQKPWRYPRFLSFSPIPHAIYQQVLLALPQRVSEYNARLIVFATPNLPGPSHDDFKPGLL